MMSAAMLRGEVSWVQTIRAWSPVTPNDVRAVVDLVAPAGQLLALATETFRAWRRR